MIYRSTDQSTWSFFNEFAAQAGFIPDRPWITGGECDKAYAVYTGVGATNYVEFLYRDGAGWSRGTNTAIADNRPGNVVYASETGYLYALYRSTTGEAGHLEVARSSDGGQTISKFNVTGTNVGELSIFPTLTNDTSGNQYAVGTPLTGVVKYSASTNNGSGWFGSPKNVSASSGSNTHQWAVARGGGKLDVAWYRSTAGSPDPNANSGPWYLFFAQYEDATSSSSTTTPIQVTPNSINNGKVCTKGFGVCSNNDRKLGDFFQIASDRFGNAKIAYANSTDNGGANATVHVSHVWQTGGTTI